MLIKTPTFRFFDVGYIKHNKEEVTLELFSAGNLVEHFTIGSFVCTSKGCITKERFNREFLVESYPEELLLNILMAKPIFNKKNIQKTKNGFLQKIETKEYSIFYRVEKTKLYFKDTRNKILIKLKDING